MAAAGCADAPSLQSSQLYRARAAPQAQRDYGLLAGASCWGPRTASDKHAKQNQSQRRCQTELGKHARQCSTAAEAYQQHKAMRMP